MLEGMYHHLFNLPGEMLHHTGHEVLQEVTLVLPGTLAQIHQEPDQGVVPV